MKKILLSVAVIGALTSCSQNDVQEMATMPEEIQFSTLNDKVTRVANDNKSKYQVYAKSFGLTGTPSTWFINDVLTTGAAGTTSPGYNNNTIDLPSKKHYWPNVDNTWAIKFFGYAPQTFGAGTATVVTQSYGSNTAIGSIATDDASISIKYTVPTNPTGVDAQEDFTIATPKVVNKPATGYPSTVNLQFKHMLTKISIAASLNQELKDAGYSMTSGTPTLGVTNTSGTIKASDANPSWTLASPAAPTVYDGNSTYLILPQPSGDTKITLKDVVIVKDGVVVFTGDVTYTVKPGDILNEAGTTDDNKFLPGKSYNMNITIAGNSEDGGGDPIFGPVISFSSEVADWGTYTPGVTQPPVK